MPAQAGEGHIGGEPGHTLAPNRKPTERWRWNSDGESLVMEEAQELCAQIWLKGGFWIVYPQILSSVSKKNIHSVFTRANLRSCNTAIYKKNDGNYSLILFGSVSLPSVAYFTFHMWKKKIKSWYVSATVPRLNQYSLILLNFIVMSTPQSWYVSLLC